MIENEYNSGHWALLLRYNNTIEWFNSYGTFPSEELDFISHQQKAILNQDSMMFPEVEVAVSQGANQNTFQQFIATSSSSSNLSFNIQPPSESIVVDRNILLSARVNFKINIGPNVSVGTNVWQYGQREAFQAFPLNNLFTTATATVNNTSVSVNTIDVLPALLQLMDEEDLACSKGMSPYLIDRYQNYSDAINANNNPLAGFKNASYNQHRLPRGSHPLDALTITRTLNTCWWWN